MGCLFRASFGHRYMLEIWAKYARRGLIETLRRSSSLWSFSSGFCGVKRCLPVWIERWSADGRRCGSNHCQLDVTNIWFPRPGRCSRSLGLKSAVAREVVYASVIIIFYYFRSIYCCMITSIWKSTIVIGRRKKYPGSSSNRASILPSRSFEGYIQKTEFMC